MARLKKNRSLVLDRAQTRAAAVQAIAGIEQLGGEATLPAFQAVIDDTRAKLQSYNTLLAQADEAREVFLKAEIQLADWHERILAAVGVQYGKTSDAYVTAGGTRKYSRQRASTQTETTTEEASAA